MATNPVAKTIRQLTQRTTMLTGTEAFEIDAAGLGSQYVTANIIATFVASKITLPTVPTTEAIVQAVLAELPDAPTLEQIVDAAVAQMPVPPTLQQVTTAVLAQMPAFPTQEITDDVTATVSQRLADALAQLPVAPTVQEVVTAVLAELPEPLDMADIVLAVLAQVPEAPTMEAIVAAVTAELPAMPTVPDLVAAVIAELPEPVTVAQVKAAVLAEIPAPPSVAEVKAAVLAEIPDAPSLEETVAAVLAQVPDQTPIEDIVAAVIAQIPAPTEPPTAAEVAALVLPQIPAPPTAQEIVDEVLDQLPDPGVPVFVPKLGMAAIGDSVVATGGEGHRTIPELICGFSDQMWLWRRHFAVGGKRVEEIEVEQLPQVFDMDPLPQCLYVGGMYNNLETSESVDAALIVQERIYTKTIAKGIVPIVQLIHPRSETQSSKDQAFRANEGLAKLRAKYNLPVVDLAAALWDPKSYYIKGNVDAGGNPSVVGKMSKDGTHLTFTGNSTAAVSTLADDRFTLLCPRDGGVQKLYNNFDPYNAAVNGLFTLVGGDGAANYWARNNTAVDAEIIYGGGPQGRGNALKVTANATGIGGGLLHDMDISWMNHFRISCTIESDWGGAGECPFNDLLNVYFCSSDYQTSYGTQFALEEPGLPHEKTTIYVEFDRPPGAGRAQLILGAMNANQVPGLTWATISLLKVDKLW